MPLLDVKVIITLDKPAGLLGFGKPLILTTGASAVAYKEYADMEGVEEDYAQSTDAYKAANAIFTQVNRPETVAIMTAATTANLGDVLTGVYDRDWYFLIPTFSTVADLITLGDKIETNGRKMMAALSSTTADVVAIKAKNYDRTFVAQTIAEFMDEFFNAAWVGEAGAFPVGSITWKFKNLVGISPQELNATQLLTIHNNGANAYVTKAGDNITSEGRVVSGEYIDVIMSKDWIQQEIEVRVQKVFNKNGKVPYTNTGIALIEGAVRAALDRAFANGMIADNNGVPLYTTTFKTRDEVSALDRASRKYNEGKFTFQLAGAIHEATIRGTIQF